MKFKKQLIFFLSLLFISFLTAHFLRAESPTTTSDQTNVYAKANVGMFNPITHTELTRVYVPNSDDGTVSVIDPTTYQVVDTFQTGKVPQHVVPAYDLTTLWVLNNRSNSATPIDPKTGKPGKSIPVSDPYNLYFTIDGQSALVVCESYKRIEFRDPKTMLLKEMVPVQCAGLNHMDFTRDGRYAIITCEFSSQLLKLDLKTHRVLGYLSLEKSLPNKASTKMSAENQTVSIPATLQSGEILLDVDSSHVTGLSPSKKMHMLSMPQDIRLSPDGSTFYVADMMRDGVVLIDPNSFQEIGFIPTGIGAHGIYPSRDGRYFYVSNRGCHSTHCPPHGPGSISVIDPAIKKVIANWPIPGGGSPDMGNISADGKELWLSGRFDKEVYVFDTTTGKLTHRIPVGRSPHGLTYWPQPGQFSLGHTGNMR